MEQALVRQTHSSVLGGSMRLNSFLALVICLSLAAGCGRGKKSQVVAEVARWKITLEDLDRAWEKLPDMYREGGKRRLLQTLIDKELLVLEAERRGLDRPRSMYRVCGL